VHTLVCGPGYTGKRVVSMLPPDSTSSVGRPERDLDDPDVCVPLPASPYALLYTIPPGTEDDSDHRLERLLSRLDPAPRRLVYLSTSGVYGNRDGELTNEDVPPAPESARARRRLAAESLVTKWCGENEVPLVILRVPAIYGPGRLGVDRIRSGLPVVEESEAGPGNRIHVDDLAACCVRALDTDAPAGIFNVGDGDHRSSTWFAKTVAAKAGLDPPAEISRDDAERTFSESRLSFLRESRTLDTTRMHEVLGFTPRYTDPEEGIRASLS
jgi:nucleoside-diphosphate-sugar epimerase